MPSHELLLSFFAATLIFAVMPGPAILYTAAQTLARGRTGGFLAALGIHVGGFAHVTAAAAGLSAVFELVPEAYAAVKIIGALYLVWLGLEIVRGKKQAADLPRPRDKQARRAFLESVLVEVLNPKAAVFYLAFLPQFVDPGAALPVWSQFLVLGLIVNLAFSAADIVTVLLTAVMLRHVRKSGTGQRIVRWLGGSMLVGLGARLALVED